MKKRATNEEALERGRQAFETQSWHDAYALLSAADDDTPLEIDDLELLATVAYMTNQHTECARAWTRAHQHCLSRNDPVRAARSAFWQACGLLFRGEMAPFLGWIARGRRILDESPSECVEKGWLLALEAVPLMEKGDLEGALSNLEEALAIAERCHDPDILAFVRMDFGPFLVAMNRTEEGLQLLDEAMVAVTSGEVSPMMAGAVYCQMIGTCKAIFDLRRAREWTTSFARWCESQQGLVSYQGNCLVDRCELLQLQGDWPEAMKAAAQARELLTDPDWETLGSAHYNVGEIHRLRGDFIGAEESYKRASEAGRDPEPGLSLLRLAQGKTAVAAKSIRRVIGELDGSMSRARALPAYVEIMLAVDDLDEASAAADELATIAADHGAPFLHATAAHTCGAALLAKGDHKNALNTLRDAWKRWQALEAPYEAARVRILIARALQALGDNAGAALELDGARLVLQQLGAQPELSRLEEATGYAKGSGTGLTERETEVLTLLASGKSNREIAEALIISEHTVARHVQNIFSKFDVSSRTAAIAFAFENKFI